MTTTETKYRDLLPIIIETTGATMPEGFDSWGIKSVQSDLATAHGFRWAQPGGLNISNDNLDRRNESACPNEPGDGLCVATTWRGMASGGIPARTLLLVAYRAADVVGRDTLRGKLRIGGAVASVALVDGERFIREHGRRASLRLADLRGMNLQGIDLSGADLWGSRLGGANLQSANLQHTNLQHAGLGGTNLSGACLQGADLKYAHLCGAKLQGAYIGGAHLQGVSLRESDLRGANIQGVDLRSADLREADMCGANLLGADLRGACLDGADLLRAYIGKGDPPIGWVSIDGHLSKEESCKSF